jgi:hypothetical protein
MQARKVPLPPSTGPSVDELSDQEREELYQAIRQGFAEGENGQRFRERACGSRDGSSGPADYIVVEKTHIVVERGDSYRCD